MGEVTQKRGADGARVRWNDIRIVGPVLVAVLMLATLVTPSFAGSEQSVGGLVDECGRRVRVPILQTLEATAGQSANAVGDFIGPCCPRAASASIVGFSFTADQCCIEGGSESGRFVPCRVPPLGSVVTTPPPPPIMGPIWLGATQSSVVNGSIVLSPPPMLALFIGDNVVTVTNEADDVVFKGTLNASNKIVLSTSAVGTSGDYTMQTLITTRAKYTEVISVDTGLS